MTTTTVGVPGGVINSAKVVLVDFAVAFGESIRPPNERLTTSLVSLYANGIKIFDGLSTTPDAPDGITVTFHQGLSHADPDPTILNAMGPSTPAFRNIIYAVIQNYPISATSPSLPTIRALISDIGDPAAPASTVFNVTPSPISFDAVWVSQLTQSYFGIEEAGFHTPDHRYVIHEYSLLDDTEIRQSRITDSAPDPVYGAHLGGTIYFRCSLSQFIAYDDENNILFVETGDSEGQSNFNRVTAIDVQTGIALSHIGHEASLGNNSDPLSPTIQAADRACIMKYRANGLPQYGVAIGGIFNTVNFVGYTHTGTASRGGRIQNGDLKLTWDGVYGLPAGNVVGLVSYPILERPELQSVFDVQNSVNQDWIGLVAGTNGTVYVMQRGLTVKALLTGPGTSTVAEQRGVDMVPLLTVPRGSILDLFINPADGAVMVIYAPVFGTTVLAKYQPQFVPTATGVTISGLIPIYDGAALPGYNAFSFRNSLKISKFDTGVFLYTTGSGAVAINLANGRTIYNSSNAELSGAAYTDWANRTVVVPVGTTGKVTRINLTGTVTPSGCLLSDFLRWSALRLGYTAGQIIITNIDDTVIGGLIESPTSVRGLLTTLSQVYGFSIAEYGGTIKFIRSARGVNQTTAAILGKEDLAPLQEYAGALGQAASNSGSNFIQTIIASPDETPADVQVTYIDPAIDYQHNSQIFRRARFPFDTVQTQRMVNYQVPFVLPASEAISHAAQVAFSGYAQSIIYTWRMPHRFVYLEPSDVLTLLDADNNPLVAQLTQITYNPDYSISCAGLNWSFNDHPGFTADAPLGFRPPRSHGPSDSFAVAMDMPIIDLIDNTSGTVLVYEGVANYGQPDWQSATMYRQINSAQEPGLYATGNALNQGVITSALPACGAAGTTFITDETTVLEVYGPGLDAARLRSLTDEHAFLAGFNACVVGRPGRWELIHYRTVTVIDPNRVQLTGLNRGRNGTDVMTDLHLSGDQCIIIDRRGGLHKDTYQPVIIGKTIAYMAVGESVNTPPAPVIATLSGASHKPWAPVKQTATLVGGNDINLAWTRRDRLGQAFVTVPVTPQPMSETVENYEVEIYSGTGVLKRTVTGLGTPALTYTSAQQTTDGFTPGSVATLHVKIFQTSALVGRGFAADKVLNVN